LESAGEILVKVMAQTVDFSPYKFWGGGNTASRSDSANRLDQTDYYEPPASKRTKRLGVPLPEQTNGYLASMVLGDRQGGNVFGSNDDYGDGTAGFREWDWDTPTMSEGGADRAYWEDLLKKQLAMKAEKAHGTTQSGPVLDEERPRPDSSANPNNEQVPKTGVNPNKPKLGGSGYTPHSGPHHEQPEDEENDGDDSGVPILNPITYDDEDTAEDPTQGMPPPDPDDESPLGNTIASMTLAEFARMKEECFRRCQDVRASEQEQQHRAGGTGPQGSGTKDDNPQTSYAPPATIFDPVGSGNKSTSNKPKGGNKDTTSRGSASDELVVKEGNSKKDKGLLGLGALLGGSVTLYGALEGISSQYVVGAGALTFYCLSHVLDLNV
jgi:hypothetical protein